MTATGLLRALEQKALPLGLGFPIFTMRRPLLVVKMPFQVLAGSRRHPAVWLEQPWPLLWAMQPVCSVGPLSAHPA